MYLCKSIVFFLIHVCSVAPCGPLIGNKICSVLFIPSYFESVETHIILSLPDMQSCLVLFIIQLNFNFIFIICVFRIRVVTCHYVPLGALNWKIKNFELWTYSAGGGGTFFCNWYLLTLPSFPYRCKFWFSPSLYMCLSINCRPAYK